MKTVIETLFNNETVIEEINQLLKKYKHSATAARDAQDETLVEEILKDKTSTPKNIWLILLFSFGSQRAHATSSYDPVTRTYGAKVIKFYSKYNSKSNDIVMDNHDFLSKLATEAFSLLANDTNFYIGYNSTAAQLGAELCKDNNVLTKLKNNLEICRKIMWKVSYRKLYEILKLKRIQNGETTKLANLKLLPSRLHVTAFTKALKNLGRNLRKEEADAIITNLCNLPNDIRLNSTRCYIPIIVQYVDLTKVFINSLYDKSYSLSLSSFRHALTMYINKEDRDLYTPNIIVDRIDDLMHSYNVMNTLDTNDVVTAHNLRECIFIDLNRDIIKFDFDRYKKLKLIPFIYMIDALDNAKYHRSVNAIPDGKEYKITDEQLAKIRTLIIKHASENAVKDKSTTIKQLDAFKKHAEQTTNRINNAIDLLGLTDAK